MSSSVVLVILTMLESGQLSVAFVNTASAQDCERRGKAVRSILTSQKVMIREIDCFESTQRFEKFSHGTKADAPRHFYRVTLNDGRLQVLNVADPATCEQGQASQNQRRHELARCVTSTQRLLDSSAPRS